MSELEKLERLLKISLIGRTAVLVDEKGYWRIVRDNEIYFRNTNLKSNETRPFNVDKIQNILEL